MGFKTADYFSELSPYVLIVYFGQLQLCKKMVLGGWNSQLPTSFIRFKRLLVVVFETENSKSFLCQWKLLLMTLEGHLPRNLCKLCNISVCHGLCSVVCGTRHCLWFSGLLYYFRLPSAPGFAKLVLVVIWMAM